MSRPPLLISGIPIQRMTRAESFTSVREAMEERPVRVAWVYAYCIVVAHENPRYLESLKAFEFVFNDGVGVELAGYLKGTPVLENLCGTDWIPDFFRSLPSSRTYRIFLLGSRPGVVVAGARLIETLGPFEVVGTYPGYFSDIREPLSALTLARPEILLVTMGVPRQELFLYEYWEKLKEAGVRLGIAGGAVLDFLTGALPRAPSWVRRLRGEWLYRLLIEPRRLAGRYILGNPRFLYYLAREEISRRFFRTEVK